jgi:hypothetical protein
MHTHGVPVSRGILILLCCLIPLVALGATLFFHTPSAVTGAVAMLVLMPVAYGLLAQT